MRRFPVWLVLPVLLLSACRAEASLRIEIEDDGAGAVHAEVGYDETAAAFLEEYGGGVFAGPGPLLAGLRNVSRSEEDRDGLHFLVATVEVEDVAAALRLAAAGPTEVLRDFRLTQTRDRLTVDARASLEDILAQIAAAAPAGASVPELTVRLSIVLPGEILSHNADDRQGGTLTWNLPTDGSEVIVRAVSDPTAVRSLPLWLLALIAAAVLAVIGAVVWRGSRHRSSGPSPAAPAPGPEVLSP